MFGVQTVKFGLLARPTVMPKLRSWLYTACGQNSSISRGAAAQTGCLGVAVAGRGESRGLSAWLVVGRR